MTNTYFGPGDWDHNEIIADTRDGILCDKMLNGMEDLVSGYFEVKCLRSFLIRKGEIVKPLQSFTLTGRSVDILSSADVLSKEVVLERACAGRVSRIVSGFPPGAVHARQDNRGGKSVSDISYYVGMAMQAPANMDSLRRTSPRR